MSTTRKLTVPALLLAAALALTGCDGGHSHHVVHHTDVHHVVVHHTTVHHTVVHHVVKPRTRRR